MESTTLVEFLATASSDNQQALAEAKAYSESIGKTITSDVMTMMLVSSGLYGYFYDCSKDTSHPARDICLALMDRMRTQSEFNLIPGTPKGDANNYLIDLLINTLMVEKQPELTDLYQQLRNESGVITFPFARVGLSDILSIRDPGQEQEVIYPGSASYLITTASQGIDVEVTLAAPAITDTNIEVYLSTCADTNDQNEPDNFLRTELSVGYIVVRQGNTQGALALSNRKVRTYNKLFVKPSFNTVLSATVRNNRG